MEENAGALDAPPRVVRKSSSLSPRARVLSSIVAIALFSGAIAIVPRTLLGLEPARFEAGEQETWRAYADSVARTALARSGPSAFHTGSARFDGEWAVVTAQMSVLSLTQVVRAHPALRARYLPAIHAACDSLADPAIYTFGAEAWDEEPLSHASSLRGDHAYLGYAALALGAARRVDPEGFAHAALHDALVGSLARHLEPREHGVLSTYPGEAYPADESAVIASIALHASLTGVDRSALVARMARTYRERFVDEESGWLAQSVDPETGAPRDGARASGTAISAYFWSFADPELARELASAVLREGRAGLLGFGGIREHPRGTSGGGDIDSGPVLLGVSVSATGFGIAAARIAGDRDATLALSRTAWLFGVPVDRSADDGADARAWLSGGPLGNALLLAMLTAERPR